MTPEELINIALEEYKSLRGEVVNSVDRQYSLANWGISAVTFFIAAVIGGWGTLIQYPQVLLATTFVVIPAVATSYVVA